MCKFECNKYYILASLQMHVLDEAAKQHPNAWWWLKGDGCDLVPGLGESTRLVWSGDVDLNDGKLQEAYKAYRERLDHVAQVQKKKPVDILSDLGKIARQLNEDVTFLHSGKC